MKQVAELVFSAFWKVDGMVTVFELNNRHLQNLFSSYQNYMNDTQLLFLQLVMGRYDLLFLIPLFILEATENFHEIWYGRSILKFGGGYLILFHCSLVGVSHRIDVSDELAATFRVEVHFISIRYYMNVSCPSHWLFQLLSEIFINLVSTYLRRPFEKFVDWRQYAAVVQREAVTVTSSCIGGGNVVVAWSSSL